MAATAATPPPAAPDPGPRRAAPLLAVEDLRVVFPADDGEAEVLRGVDLAVACGEMLGVVGESGSGKTMTALAVLGLVPWPGRITAGRVVLAGEGDLLRLPERRLRCLRGRRLAMVFQEPATALDPVFTVGYQVGETLRLHRGLRGAAARREALRLLDRVAMPDARRRLDAYPHELSGGQRQRAMIAVALAGGPDVLLADEPTTALDVLTQAQILDLLDELRRDLGLAVVLVTHDLAVVAETCDRVVVLDAGRVVEEAAADAVFARPLHPRTRELVAALAPPPDPAGSAP